MGSGHAHALYVHEHSAIHRLPAHVKIVAVFAFVVAVALTPRQAVWAFVVDAAILSVAVRLARVPVRFLLARLAVITPFVAFALFIPFIAGGTRTEIWGVSVSVEGLWAMWNVLAKASLGATASIVLAATTEVPDLIRGLGRLRLPAVVVAIAGFMIRYLELIAAEMRRMRVAMTARGYDPRWLWQAKPIASASGALFIRSYERGERVHQAMLARGFTGAMPDLDHRTATAVDWRLVAPLVAVAWTVLLIAVVV